MENNVQIGWSEVSITPERKIQLAGQFYKRVSQYVETPITVTALALDNGEDHVVFCSADLESVDPCLMKGVRANLAGLPNGPDPEKIIISATHTHTSFVYEREVDPGLQALSAFLGKNAEAEPEAQSADEMSPSEATAFLIDRLTLAVKQAWESRTCGYYGFGFGRAAVGMCRRVCYADGSAKMWGDTNTKDFFALEGGNDNGMELMFTYDMQEKITGIVINVACPAQVLEQRYFVSSDYWGKVKILLRRELGENVRVLGICSPAGDQCPRDLVRWIEPETPIEDPNVIRRNPPLRRADPSMYDIRGTWTIGRRIAGEVLAVLQDPIERKRSMKLRHETAIMPLPLRRVTEEENRQAREILAQFSEKKGAGTVDFTENAAMHVWAGIAARYDRQQKESVVPVEIHVLRVGDVAFATSPFELFLDFANLIRARSRSVQTFLLQLACDSKGYLPTEKAEKGGHYSAYISSGNVGHEGGYLLVENTLSAIERMFSEDGM